MIYVKIKRPNMVNSYWFNNLTTFISAAQNPYYPKPYSPFQGFKFFPFGGAPYGARCVRWNVPGGVNYTGKKWVGIYVMTLTVVTELLIFNGQRLVSNIPIITQKMKFSIKDFFSKCYQIRRKFFLQCKLEYFVKIE